MTTTPRDVFGSLRGSILMDCPVEHAWKCAFEFPKWAPTIKGAELISGAWDQEGGVVLITKHDWVGLDPFCSANLKLRPYAQQVYRLDSRKGDQLHGFVDISFDKIGSQVRVTYSNYLTCRYEKPLSLEDLQGEKAVEGIQGSYLKPFKEYAEKTFR